LNDEDSEEVHVPEFYISKCTVTNEQYRRFVEAAGHKPPEHWARSGQPFPEADARKPVVRVSYDDAEAYCKWLGVRLPTGVEWEKAARGENSLLYPWGNEYRKGVCNSAEVGKGSVVPADEFPEGDSPYGCRQMVGNVFEWVDEPHPDDPNFRYLRGGAWCVSCQYLGLPFLHYIASARISSRLSSPNPSDTFGFRVAITNLPQPKSVAASFHDSHCGDVSKDPLCPVCGGNDYADFAPGDLRQPDCNPYTWIGYFDIG
jgi:formylglycine-generating enzyme required for sulfatase activity